MGRAKKRYYRLSSLIRTLNPYLTPLEAYYKAIDIDQRRQAKLQAERWREDWEKKCHKKGVENERSERQ